MAAKKENTLEAQLAKRGFESVSVGRPIVAGEAKVEANKLCPISIAGGEPVYTFIPVSMSVKLNKSGLIQSIEGDTPSDSAVRDAAHFLNWLRERGQVVDEPDAPAAEQGDRASASRATHRIVRDEQGRRVLRRQRVSI
jgi:hypothetical protein